MQHSRLTITLPASGPMNENAFVPCPAFLMAGMSWQQMWWQQQVYQQVWAAACGPRLVRVRVADLPRVLRN